MIINGITTFVRCKLYFTILALKSWILNRRIHQRDFTYFASVTLNVIVSIESNDSNGFFLIIAWQYSSMASITAWSKLLMKTFNTMYFHGCIDSKRNTIQTFTADKTAETCSMIRFTSRTKNLIKMTFSY